MVVEMRLIDQDLDDLFFCLKSLRTGIVHEEAPSIWTIPYPATQRQQRRKDEDDDDAHHLLMLLMAMGSADTTNTNDEAVQIKRFGKYGVEDFKTTVNCGASINWFNNVTVCSNGNYQGTSNSCGSCDFTGKVCQFQSFEYAARYLKQNGGIDYSQWRWNDMDDDPCLAYPWPYIVQVNSDPVPGDMIVIYMGNAPQGQRYHHSAIVTQFLPPTYINVVEQNAASSGSNTYQRVQVECILRVNSTQLHG